MELVKKDLDDFPNMLESFGLVKDDLKLSDDEFKVASADLEKRLWTAYNSQNIKSKTLFLLNIYFIYINNT